MNSLPATQTHQQGSALATPVQPQSKRMFQPVALPARAFGPVIQAQLVAHTPYKAVNAVAAFSAVNGVNPNRQINQNESVTVIEHVGQPLKTRIHNHDQLQKMLFTTAGNDANFQAIGAPLANAEQAAYNVPAPVANSQIDYTDFYKDMANEPAPALGHVRQGEIGDCWLIAAMGAMANSPHWGQQLLPAIQSQNATNSYNVTLGVYNAQAAPGAVLNQVVVNNMTGHLPVLPNGNPNGAAELAYAQQTSGIPAAFAANANATPVWPAMLEKAYAIDQGGYQALDNRDAREGLAVLSGIMPEQYTGAAVDAQRWTAIQQQFAAGAAITVTSKANAVLGHGVAPMTHGTEGHVDHTAFDLIEDHVYVLTGMTNTHITLQNPHGHSHPDQLQIANLPNYVALIDVLPAPAAQQPQQAQGGGQQAVVAAPAQPQQQQQAQGGGLQAAAAPVVAQPQQQQQGQVGGLQAAAAPVVVQPQQQQQAQGGGLQAAAAPVVAQPQQQQQAQGGGLQGGAAPVVAQPQQQQQAQGGGQQLQQQLQAILPAPMQLQVQMQAQQLQQQQAIQPAQLLFQALLNQFIPPQLQQQLAQLPPPPPKRRKPNPQD